MLDFGKRIKYKRWENASFRARCVNVKYFLKKAFRNDFNDEIEFMKRLNVHVHLVNILGCISDPQNLVLVLELCVYGDLLRLLRSKKQRQGQVEKVRIKLCINCHIRIF